MKKASSLLLALVIVMALLMIPAMAADYSGAIGGFATSSKSTYNSGIFSDIDENAWYGANEQGVIQKLYELQIMNGKGDGTFDPAGNITIAEAIKMAAVVHDIYNGGDGVFTQSALWYQVYVDYAIASGVIDAESFGAEYERTATRREMAAIFANCVPAEVLPEINKVVYLPDVEETREWLEESLLYGDDIFMLYRAGVLTGSDSTGQFRPYDYITRAEAAAIICRVVLPAQRKTLNLSQVVVNGDYVTDELLAGYDAFEEFIEFDEERYLKIMIMTNMTIKNFKFIEVALSPDDEDGILEEKSVRYSLGELSPDKPFVVTWLEIGSIPHRGISFVDEKNVTRYFSISMSGLDGSLRLVEFF